MKEDWIRIELPEDNDEMTEVWTNFHGQSIGLCILCGTLIRTESELIQGTTTHDCKAGRDLERQTNNTGPPIEI